ncbi:Integrase, catalytic core [Corchorus capsularis]|uniref:Integrase, catalytic core n=1 Tax=Corchorus capsularis TaxID=210143 RepID=A0A1R3K3V9_COCAP|nr:Integrase, catalytic core [Corchorus capsularis]
MAPKLNDKYTEGDDGASFYMVIYALGKFVRDPNVRDITIYVEHDIDFTGLIDEVPLLNDGLGCCESIVGSVGASGVGPEVETVDLTESGNEADEDSEDNEESDNMLDDDEKSDDVEDDSSDEDLEVFLARTKAFTEENKGLSKVENKRLANFVLNQLNIRVNIRKCKRARKKIIAANFKEEFAEMWDYAEELISKNPGSTIKGLKVAIREEMPHAEHRNCARHVFSNWSGKRLEKTLHFDLWNIVRATTQRKWDDKVAALNKNNENSAKELMHKDRQPKQWTRAFFGEICKSDMVDNNACLGKFQGYLVVMHVVLFGVVGGNPHDFLHHYYSPETYAKAYNCEHGHNRAKCPNKDKATVGAVSREPSIPKGRGRPPKDKGKAAGDNGQPSLPKKRGRPPKNPGNGGNQFLNGEPTTKRKGRPLKDTTTTRLGKTSSKGYGNYMNEKTGQSQFCLFNPEAFRTQGCSSTSRGTGSSKTYIVSMYSDGGGEYEKLKQFFQTHGISHLQTPPHTPEHNGISERRHRHVVETGLALLSQAKLAFTFWNFAFKIATYLMNPMPTPILDEISLPSSSLESSSLQQSSPNTVSVSEVPLISLPSKALKDEKWCDAMSEEINALLRNGTWQLVPKSDSQNLSNLDPSLFFYYKDDVTVYFLVYVDDIIITGSDLQFVKKFVSDLSTQFSLKELLPLHYFLGIKTMSVKDGLFLSQRKYIVDLLQSTNMIDSKAVTTPMATTTSLTIDDSESLSDPTEYRSIIGALQHLIYRLHSPSILAYTDADWAGDKWDRKSVSSSLIYFAGNLVS